MIDCIEKGVTTRQLILVVALDEPTAALDPIAENEIYSRFNSFEQSKTAIYISHRLSSCVSIPSPCLITQGWWKAARIQRFWLPTANMQRCGTRRQSIMCSLQQHNNAAPGENEKMKEKAKNRHPCGCLFFFLQNVAAVLLTSVQKCDLIYTERFGIVKTAGARTKQLQIAK